MSYNNAPAEGSSNGNGCLKGPSPTVIAGSKKHRHDDEIQGKLFVGGLSWDTTQDSLLSYFSRFGEVIDCVVMKNQETGRCRGFGFVTYSNPDNINAVLASCPHTLDGRTVDPKACNPRSMQKPKKSNMQNFPKVFLGGLPSSITETDLRSFFSRYGDVVEVVIMYDQEKKKSRGFGFLSFAEEGACAAAVADHFVNISNKQVEIKRAEPRTNQQGASVASAVNDAMVKEPPPTAGAAPPPTQQMEQWGSAHVSRTPNSHQPPPPQAPPPVPVVTATASTPQQHSQPPPPPPQHQVAYPPVWGALPSAPAASVAPAPPPHPSTAYPSQYTSPPVNHAPVQHQPTSGHPSPQAAAAAALAVAAGQQPWGTPPPSQPPPPPPGQQPPHWAFSSPPPPGQAAASAPPPPQPTQYPGIYPPPPSTPQPTTYWGASPVAGPTHPQAPPADPYAAQHHLQASQTPPNVPKLDFSQYSTVAPSAAPPPPGSSTAAAAAPAPPPLSQVTYAPFSQYPTPVPSSVKSASVAPPPQPPPYATYEYTAPVAVGPPAAPAAAPVSYTAAGAATAPPAPADLSGSNLGPQRAAIYGTQPSTYHPYRRT